jgi:hypothetical protein
MELMEMFAKASRIKLRFDSSKGQLAVEDLWDLPLTSDAGKVNLDDIARELHKQIKDGEEVSFVKKASSDSQKTAAAFAVKQLKFNIIKYIIDVRVAENEAAQLARANREQKQKILKFIAEKQDGDLRNKSEADLQAMLAALGDD